GPAAAGGARHPARAPVDLRLLAPRPQRGRLAGLEAGVERPRRGGAGSRDYVRVIHPGGEGQATGLRPRISAPLGAPAPTARAWCGGGPQVSGPGPERPAAPTVSVWCGGGPRVSVLGLARLSSLVGLNGADAPAAAGEHPRPTPSPPSASATLGTSCRDPRRRCRDPRAVVPLGWAVGVPP